jgi:KipI family sensor histidine kinase inhibitor
VSPPRIKDAGDAAVLLEFEPTIDVHINARVIAVAAAVRRLQLAGVRDVVSTYRSVAVYFDPLMLDVSVLRAALERSAQAPPAYADGRLIEVPVVYGGVSGPDLESVAAFGRLGAGAVIERHAGVPYRAFMLGFLPGFAYLGPVDERIAAPRHAVPRLRVPVGAVGIAGQQTGVYPHTSPGGWQIVGRTPTRVFDPLRTPSALIRAGDTVRFVSVRADDLPPRVSSGESDGAGAPREPSGRAVTVVRAGLLTTIQDDGRWGHQSEGVPVSGALDRVSHRVANALVGNDPGAATLEVTVLGPTLRIEAAARVAVAGADLGFSVDGRALAANEAMECRPGAVLQSAGRRDGARAYVAFEGGVASSPVLGSQSTHTLAGLGGLEGRALRPGDRVPLGPVRGTRSARHVEVLSPVRRGGARVRVVRGPQDEFFPERALDLLQTTRFTITPQSDRMGYRLSGGRLPRLEGREMISDATFAGGVQVPPSGEPILLMSDRQTSGGYPQIATVISADLPVVGQLAPGDWLEFEQCSRDDALAALVAQEAALSVLW